MTQLLSVREAAKLLKVSTSTLYKYAERNQIGCIKMGAMLRFSESHLESFISKHAVGPESVKVSGGIL